MNKQQFKKMRHNARVCRQSERFMRYDEQEPIPESLQPFLLPIDYRTPPVNMLTILRQTNGDISKNSEWIRKRIRCNYSGVFK